EDSESSIVRVCGDCKGSLLKKKMPRFALANNLYRGHLPEDLRDLTWVEEMVCAIYRTTAHVSRMYENSNGSERNPLKFFGNTCAHDTNIVSTASVLPRTPADVLGNISVVFVGPGEIVPDQICDPYRVRKDKVWKFLLWLKANNPLYRCLEYSRENLEMYNSADGVLPGLRESIIHDK
ncbi:hypothetical protein SISSUDRAFT_962634, partial [Sistotremastrum suecicum HHB10207 ss-3]